MTSPAPAQSARRKTHANAPIGVFDSGVGGLSILQALQWQLPQESFVYLADSAHAPYGERDETFVADRATHVLQSLLHHHQIKAFVVACNTATALAIHVLRHMHPDLPIFGVEPAVKPAAQHTQTGRVGVMATAGTLGSEKFQTLLQGLRPDTEFILQACDGLADAIERQSNDKDDLEVRHLCRKYLQAMGAFGKDANQIDTLVLGCTHYPFAKSVIQDTVGNQVVLIDNGAPVAKRVAQVLQETSLLCDATRPSTLALFATGQTSNLQRAAAAWLGISPSVGVM